MQEAISTHPSYATAHENIGDIYAKMASQAYNKALQLDEGNQTAREKLSLIGELFSAPISVAAQQSQVEPDEQIPQKQVIAKAKKNTDDNRPVKELNVAQDDKAITEKSQTNEKNKNEILKSVNSWAEAWSAQDVNNYLGFYSSDFVPPDELARDSWEELRAERLKKPSFISVDITNPEITLHGNEHASISFSQNYQSDSYSDQVDKTLLMKNVEGRWLIVEERSK